MSRSFFLVRWGLLLVLAATAVGLRAQPPRADALGPLRAQLLVELQFVRKICAPSKPQMQAITKDLEKCLADAAKRTGPSSCDLLPPALADSVANHLSKSDAARYRAEVLKRDAQEREACVYTFVTLVDPDLGLSDHQRKALVAALLPVWKPVWSQMIEMDVRWATRRVPPIPDDFILPLLNADQAQAWKRLPKNLETRQAFDAQRIGAIGTPNPLPDDE
jgi:hypothetical protein